MKNVIKGLRLYDYNRDGHIQKHELRKVLENYCFRMNDEQYEKYILTTFFSCVKIHYPLAGEDVVKRDPLS